MYAEKYEKYRDKIDFIKSYRKASNAATGSKYDSNANVEHKNICTCAGELVKGDKIGVNRLLMIDKITEMFDKELADEYIRQIESHELYKHDETNISPYCVAITMYPFLLNGLRELGGVSKAPKHIESFSGEFINLIYAIAAQFAGAIASPEFILYTDYFIRKDFGDDYLDHLDEYVTPPFAKHPKTLKQLIEGYFQQIVHSINQPAAARDYQSCFWNVSYFDKPYFEGMFGEFMFPDETEPIWETFNWLQKDFMIWLNNERLHYDLSFPVETVNLLNDGREDFIDEDWGDFQAEMYSKGAWFFTYSSNTVDSLSSCCRLRNEVNENTFSFTLGAGGVATGSKGVMTININRLVQNAVREGKDISEAVREQVKKVHKYLAAYNEIVWDSFKSNMLTVYKAGFIDLDKQYLTIGINGFVEGAEFLGIEISPNEKYFEYGEKILKPIYEENKKARTEHLMFNTEFVPAESLGVKNAKWDKRDGYVVPRDCYNSYFYIVEDETTDILSKFELHGKKLTRYLDGGSAQHNNLAEHLTKEQYKALNKKAIKEGCSYWTYNVKNTVCNKCDYRSKHTLDICPRCGSRDLDYITRIIGYTKRISSFAEPRQGEESRRFYQRGKGRNFYGKYEPKTS